ncbi:hypothetical protein ABK040_013863 [Willaertia magna]
MVNNGLAIVLSFKILVTTAAWVIPLVFFPEKLLAKLQFELKPLMYGRLLGVAYSSLLVGYGHGLYSVLAENTYPRHIVWMGLVSNGGAFTVLLSEILNKMSSGKKPKVVEVASTIAVGLISLGLLIFGPLSN